MVEGPPDISKTTQPPEPLKSTTPKTKDTPPPPGSVRTSGMPQPFKGMDMTKPQIKQFWNSMVKQMNSAINKNTAKMKKAMEELKKSEE